MKSGKSSLKEKLIFLFPILGYLFMQLSALGVFKNYYQANVAAAGTGWHIAGLVLSIATVGWGMMIAKDDSRVSKSDTMNPLILFVLAVLSLCAYAGFVFNIA